MVDLNKHIYGNGFGPGGLDSWLSVTEGLTLVAPFVKTNEVYSVAGGNMEALTTETVDADGTKRSWGGVIAQATANTARWQPGRGVLAEGGRANGQVRSQELGDVLWSKFACSVSSNDDTAPDGSATADRIIENGVNATHYIADASEHSNGTAHVVTAFMRAGPRTWGFIYGDNAFGAALAYYNLGTCTVGTVAGTSSPSASIEQYPGGWCRCRLSYTATGDGARFSGYGSAQADLTKTYLGDGASYISGWGIQSEQAPFPSSYIPTAAASVARAADILQIDNTGGLHCAAAQGTALIAVTPHWDAADLVVSAAMLELRVNAADGWFIAADQALNEWRYFVRSGGATVADISPATGVPANGVTQILGLTWDTNDFRIYIDGLLAGSDGAGAAPANIRGTVLIGTELSGGQQADADIGCLICADRPFNAREVQSVTKDIAREMGVLL